MGHVCLLYPEAVLCPPLGQTLLLPLPGSCPLLPLSPIFVSYFLLSVPLGQINLLCAENLVWGGPETAPTLSAQAAHKLIIPLQFPEC